MGGFTLAVYKHIVIKGIPSDILIIESTGEENESSTSYVEKKAIKLPPHESDMDARITFTLKGVESGYSAYGKIYVNGVATGAERSTDLTTYVTFSEDLTGLPEGSRVSLYLKGNVGARAAYSNNMSIKGSVSIDDQKYTVIL